jgi:tetratricopeptide (TPR) repeat protein
MNSQFAKALEHHQAGRLADARALYLDILQAAPNHPGALGRLAAIIAGEGNIELAIKLLGHALNVDGNNAANWLDLGLLLAMQDRHAAAVEAFTHAAKLRPLCHETARNRAFALLNAARVKESIIVYDQAAALAPDDLDVRMGRAGARLLAGDLPGGWDDYEARRGIPDFSPIASERPEWSLAAPSDSTVLVYAEQGYGDSIQFLRYLWLVSERGYQVVFRVQKAAKAFIAASLPFPLIGDDEPLPAHDFQIPLVSLPLAFQTSLETIPAPKRYLTAEPERVAKWRARLPQEGFKIGVVWQGRPKPSIDHGRSIPLAAFAPLIQPGVKLISLQKLFGLEQLTEMPEIFDLGPDFDPGPDYYRDTAAVMEGLDIVITSDTSAAHLAGALGRPVWVLLKKVPDWRWGMEGENCLWYPSMRLFRQEIAGDWGAVFARMANELLVFRSFS